MVEAEARRRSQWTRWWKPNLEVDEAEDDEAEARKRRQRRSQLEDVDEAVDDEAEAGVRRRRSRSYRKQKLEEGEAS